MGVCFSKETAVIRNNKCYICSKCICTQRLIKCFICKMMLHPECESDLSRENGNKTYCKCTQCRNVGTFAYNSNTECEHTLPV